MSEDPGSNVKKPMEPSGLLEVILIFITSLLSKAIGYLSAFTYIFQKSSTPSKSLSDMPVDVVSLIVKRLDYEQQLKLRRVSKSLRALVDKLKPACKSIDVSFWSESVTIDFDDRRVKYQSYHKYNDDVFIVRRDDCMKVAFDDLASTLKNPKLRLEKFNTSVDAFVKENLEEFYNEIHRVLESLNYQLSVKKVKLDVLSPSNLLSILSCLKPGFLEKISLSFDHSGVDWRNESFGMNKVALLDQWKHAEELELQFCFDVFPMKHATHFKKLHIADEYDIDKFIRIKDFLSELDNFEQCILSCWEFSNYLGSVYKLLGAPVSSNATEEIFRHSIPDSDFYFEFTWSKGSGDVIIEKKKREVN